MINKIIKILEDFKSDNDSQSMGASKEHELSYYANQIAELLEIEGVDSNSINNN